jgi:hypothetical protein
MSARGRFDPFAKPLRNGLYLREADFRDNALFVRFEIGPEFFAEGYSHFQNIVL